MASSCKAGQSHNADTTSRDAGDECSDSLTDSGYGGSVCEFNSHTYHPFHLGAYLCPNDEQENERLDIQHEAFMQLFGGKLYFAPLSTNPPKRILDVGTGSGLWAIDIAEHFEGSEVFGVDISSSQPRWVPPNLSFYTDDARMEWSYPHQFDYIHTRATVHMGCWGDFKSEIIQQAFDNLSPGGWFESQEVASLVRTDDGTMSEQGALAGWVNYLNTASFAVQQPRDVAPKMAQWYREVGFVDVRESIFKIPLGAWPADTRLKQAGILWQQSLVDGLGGLSRRLFNVALGWGEIETEVYLVGVRKELKDIAMHGYSTIHVVHGRKPFFGGISKLDEPNPRGISDLGGSLLDRDCESAHQVGSCTEQIDGGLYSQGSNAGYGSVDTQSISETTSGVDSDNSDGDWVYHQQRGLVNRIVQRLCLFLDSKISGFKEVDVTQTSEKQSDCPGHSSEHDSQPQSRDNSSSRAADEDTTNRKRRLSDRDSEEGKRDDGDGDNRRRKRPNVQHYGGESEEFRKLACPYYKRNKRKYCNWTSCPGPGWNEVHRLKGHLYRRHALPPQCPRCWETFTNEGVLTKHLQQDPPCVKKENLTVVEGFTKEQEKQLRSRKKNGTATTEEDKWRDIYRILFPDDDPDRTPIPYYDIEPDAKSHNSGSEGVEGFAVFLRREMPSLVRRELRAMFQAEFHDIEESARPRVEQVVLDLLPRLVRMYQEMGARDENEPHTEMQQEDLSRDILLTEATEDPSWSDTRTGDTDEMTGQGQLPDQLLMTSDLEFTSDIDFEALLDEQLFGWMNTQQ